MPPSRRHQVNSWIGVTLFCSITLWISVFYVVEAHKITQDVYASDYTEYYKLVSGSTK